MVLSRTTNSIEFYNAPEIVDFYAGKHGVTACERYAFDKCVRPRDAVLDILEESKDDIVRHKEGLAEAIKRGTEAYRRVVGETSPAAM